MFERDVILSVEPESLMRTAVQRHKMNQAELLQNDLLHPIYFGEEGSRYLVKSAVLMRTAERELRSHY
jgi:hypothetical protein